MTQNWRGSNFDGRSWQRRKDEFFLSEWWVTQKQNLYLKGQNINLNGERRKQFVEVQEQTKALYLFSSGRCSELVNRIEWHMVNFCLSLTLLYSKVREKQKLTVCHWTLQYFVLNKSKNILYLECSSANRRFSFLVKRN